MKHAGRAIANASSRAQTEPGPVLIPRSVFSLDEEAATTAVVICHRRGTARFVYGHAGSRYPASSGFPFSGSASVWFPVKCTHRQAAPVVFSESKAATAAVAICHLEIRANSARAPDQTRTKTKRTRRNRHPGITGQRKEPRSDTGPLPGGRPALLGTRGVPRPRVHRPRKRQRAGAEVDSPPVQVDKQPRCGPLLSKATGHRACRCSAAVVVAVLCCVPSVLCSARPLMPA